MFILKRSLYNAMSIHSINLKWRKLRDWLFSPLVRMLDKWDITPGGVTDFRLFLALIFLPTYYYNNLFAIAVITLELFLDMIDGSLARFQGKCSDRGHFMDVLVDALMYSMMVITFFGDANVLNIGLNLVFVNFLYLLATLKKNEGLKTDWIINPYPRSAYVWYLPMVAFYGYNLFEFNMIEISLLVSNTLSIFLFLFYYIALRSRWSRTNQ